VYLGKDCFNEFVPHLDAGERITVKLMSFDEAKAYANVPDPLNDSIKPLFDKASSIQELAQLPHFSGKRLS
jgi:hypothetical protein